MPKQINKFSRRTNVVVVNNTHIYILVIVVEYIESLYIYTYSGQSKVYHYYDSSSSYATRNREILHILIIML